MCLVTSVLSAIADSTFISSHQGLLCVLTPTPILLLPRNFGVKGALHANLEVHRGSVKTNKQTKPYKSPLLGKELTLWGYKAEFLGPISLQTFNPLSLFHFSSPFGLPPIVTPTLYFPPCHLYHLLASISLNFSVIQLLNSRPLSPLALYNPGCVSGAGEIWGVKT